MTPMSEAKSATEALLLGRLPWHPVLFAVVIVVSFWLDAPVSPFAAIRALVAVVAGAAFLTFALGLVLRSASLGGLAATGIVAALWSRQLARFGSGVMERMDLWIAGVWLGLVVFALVVALRMVLRRRNRITADGWTSVLNRVALLLVAASVLHGILNGRFIAAAPDLSQGVDLRQLEGNRQDVGSTHPDIYAILLDGYPRADVLAHAFDIDNAPFLAQLEERDFQVATDSHSDYLWTHLTVPSTLNMAYVERIPQAVAVAEGRAPRQPTLRRAIADGEVLQTAGEAGYTTVAIHSGFEEVALRQADVFLDGGQLNEFELKLLLSTWASELIDLAAPDLASAQQRDRVRHTLSALPDVARHVDSPKLVLSHVPSPHSPVVFGNDGEPVTVRFDEAFFADSPLERGQKVDEFVAAYRDQLPHLNDLIIQAIDGILTESSRPPVIVLFADHGSATRVDWNVTQPADADPGHLLERTGILFAAHTPGRSDVFPDDISPVNLFRHLFDAYLGTEYGPAQVPADGGHVHPIDRSVLDE